MKACYTLLLLICITSCVTLPKALDKITENEVNAKLANQAIKDKWEQVIASNCATWYPVKESTETDTETIQGNSEELKQELKNTQALADSLKQALASIPVKPECKPEVQARDNIIRQLQARIQALNTLADNLKADIQRVTTTKTQESTAKVTALQLEKIALQEQLVAAKKAHLKTLEEKTETDKQNRTYFWGLVIAGLIGIGIIALKFLKPF